MAVNSRNETCGKFTTAASHDSWVNPCTIRREEQGPKDVETETHSHSRRVDSLLGVPIRRLVAVTAHPDDESFGLGGVLSTLVTESTLVSVLCFTHGERSTLGTDYADLGTVRCTELIAAAHVLGLDHVTLFQYPDGRLAEIPVDELVDHVLPLARDADALLVFDEGGVTGHPDHCSATAAALAVGDIFDLPIFAWALPQAVAEQLNEEFGASFVGRPEGELNIVLEVDRARQLEAIACHRSQTEENPVLWRRLDLLGDREWLRCLRTIDEQPTCT
jgi:N-acetylglucosamine malate deacetylase 2